MTGKWSTGTSLPISSAAVGRYRGAKEIRSIRYEFKIAEPGEYEVRMNYAEHENRATKAPVTVESADGKKELTVNEKEKPSLPQGFISFVVNAFCARQTRRRHDRWRAGSGTLHAVDAVQLLKEP